VDELTPYYQERIRWLPPMQRKIVEYLCVCEGTVPVKEIAKRLFATPQTISSQLQDLREKGYVEANQRGRESLYEISEPLMRICVEVKDNQRHQPLRLLVDFLRVWYEDHELKNRLGLMEPASVASAYLKSAIERNNAEGNLRKQILLEEFRVSLPEKISAKDREAIVNDAGKLPESAVLALQFWAEGKTDQAQQCLQETLITMPDPSSRVSFLGKICKALNNRGSTHGQAGDAPRAIADYTAVIDLPSAPVEQVARALVNRGVTHGQAGDAQREIADYTAVIDLPGASVEMVARALVIRAITHGQAGDAPRAIADYTAVIDLPGASVEMVATALYSRGVTHFQNSRKPESKSDFDALTRLQEAPMDRRADANLALSELHFSEGRWSEGFRSLEASLDCGAKVQPVYRGTATDLVGAVFSAGLNPDGRHDKVTELLRIYGEHQALPVLGEAVVQHIGSVFRAGEPFPSADNLEGWASAWEQATENEADFRLSVRLLRTGIDYVKAGGKDPGILLTLTTPERAILEQALGLAEGKDTTTM